VVALQYPVIVKRGALDGLAGIVRSAGAGSRVAIITDRNVGRRYGKRVARLLGGAPVFTIPAGEQHKNRKTWAMLTDRLLHAGFGRDTTIVALGGGVIGDLAGFVAATYMRGIPVVQVPTTLLAMVDASVGGKTGVDTRAGKNLVGAFHRPAAVVIDPDVLRTLPSNHVRAGFAEIIKHGVVADAAYFGRALTFVSRYKLNGRDGAGELTSLIQGSIEIKAAVVARDERESGMRKILNFGHTIGHAVEAAKKFSMLHGDAVAIGMAVESEIAEVIGVAATGTAASVATACRLAGLPVALPRIPSARLIEFARRDKKSRAGTIHCSLPVRIGEMAAAESGWSVPIKATVLKSVLSNRS
jgi:3-dehydroquinate synthase